MNCVFYIINGKGQLLLADPAEAIPNWSLLNIIGQFFFLAAIFALIVLLAIYSLKLASRFRNYSGMNNNLRLIESRSLGGQNYVHVVKAGNKYIMVGSSKESVTFLTELDHESISDTFETNTGSSFESLLSNQIKKIFKKGTPPEE